MCDGKTLCAGLIAFQGSLCRMPSTFKSKWKPCSQAFLERLIPNYSLTITRARIWASNPFTGIRFFHLTRALEIGPYFTWENRTGRCPRPPQPTLHLHLFLFLPVSPSNLQNWEFRPRVPALAWRRSLRKSLLVFPKPCFCFQKSKIKDLYFISLRKTSKPDLSEGLKEFKEDKRNRYRLLVLWLFCSFHGWVGQDVLKSQKKGIFKTLSEEGFVNWRLSGLPSVCISSLFI